MAEKYGISREDQDQLAVSSHRNAQRAIEEGRFREQILPIELKSRKGPVLFDTDEHVRFNCELDRITSYNVCYTKLLRARG